MKVWISSKLFQTPPLPPKVQTKNRIKFFCDQIKQFYQNEIPKVQIRGLTPYPPFRQNPYFNFFLWMTSLIFLTNQTFISYAYFSLNKLVVIVLEVNVLGISLKPCVLTLQTPITNYCIIIHYISRYFPVHLLSNKIWGGGVGLGSPGSRTN